MVSAKLMNMIRNSCIVVVHFEVGYNKYSKGRSCRIINVYNLCTRCEHSIHNTENMAVEQMKPYAKEEEDDLQRRRYQVMMIEMIDEEV